MAVDYSALNSAVIFGAGAAAGFINSMVGSGTLISFPTLVGLGFGERVANISNGAGLFPGGLSAVASQRVELRGQRTRLFRLVPASLVGGIVGAILLLNFPGSFSTVVPFLVLFGVALVLVGPSIQSRLKQRAAQRGTDMSMRGRERLHPLLLLGVFFTGIYGGYFGAAQGVILIGMLGIGLDETLPRINATKNVLSAIVNGIAAFIYATQGEVDWHLAGIIAVGSVIGAAIGARVGRRIPPNVLRGVIAVVGIIAAVRLFLR